MDILRSVAQIFLLLVVLTHHETLHAQSFSIGHQKYLKGDFAGAEAALSAALKGASSGERPKILKFRGISQFMLGNKSGATTSFKEALALSPQLTIDATDVLDDSVIPFFETIKATSASSASKNDADRAGKTGATTHVGTKELQQTLLKVISTPPDSEITIDGIFAGRGGDLINVEPGTVPVTVSAPDHEPKDLKITIRKNRENSVTVTLEKIKPKPKPAPKPKERVTAGNTTGVTGPRKKEAPTAASRKSAATSATGTKPQAAQAAPTGPNLAQQFEMDAASAAAPPPAYAPPPAAPAYSMPGYYGGYGYRPPSGRRRYREDPDYFYLSLPFGIGQFHQDRHVAGVFFLATEAGGIYLAAKTSMTLSKAAKDEAKLRNSCTDESPCNDQFKADRDKYLEDFSKYKPKARNSITTASIAVFTLMIWGAADAIIKDPAYQTPPPPRRSRRASLSEGDQKAEIKGSSWHWHLALVPPRAYDEPPGPGVETSVSSPTRDFQDTPGLLWNVEWNF